MSQARAEVSPSALRLPAVPVTAVVVTRGPTDHLPRTLAGLAAQTRLPDDVLLVDAAGNAAELDDGWDTGSCPLTTVSAPGARTFGAAVRAGLADVQTSSDWLWLLHDDSAPDPTALANLLRAVEHAPSVGVAGCKQRTWSDPPRVVEAGVTTSRFGRRMSGLDGPEVDQGQYDSREDVLAVGTAGALVRRDVWDALGGTDPALGPYGDGLDLCRRARLAGHRVVVVPSAVVRHAQASLHGGRREWDAGRSSRARRESYLHSQLVGVPAWAVPAVAVLAVVSGVVRALGRIATKEPGLVAGELLAPWRVLARPGRILRARRRARMTRVLPRRALRPLEATWRDVVRQLGDRRMAAVEQRRSRRAPSELEISELAALRLRRRATLGAVLVGATAIDLVVLGTWISRVLGGDRLVGGTLAFGDAGPGELWAAATSWWAGGGYGQAAAPDPFLVVLVPLTAVVGTVGRAAAVVLLGSLVLAAVGAWFASGAATRSVALRTWAVLVWLGAPALLVSVEQARLGAVLAHAVLPWFLLGLARGLGAARTDVVESGLVGAARLARRPDDAPTPDAPTADARTPDVAGRTSAAGAQADADGWADEWPDDGRWPGEQVTPREAVLRSAVVHAKVEAEVTADTAEGAVAGEVSEPTAATDEPTAGADVPVGDGDDADVGPVARRRTGAWATADPSLAAAAGAALAFAVLTAAAPVLLPAGLLLLLAAAPVVRRRRRLLWIPLPALALHGPVIVAALTTWDDGGWRLLVAEPGLPLAGAAAPAWQQVLGWPVPVQEWTALPWPELVGTVLPLVATGLILLLAVPALLLPVRRARAARVAWVAVAVGTAAALVASRVVTGVAESVDTTGTGAGTDTPVSTTGAVEAVASAAPGISLALAGALAAALLAAGAVRSGLDRHSFGWRQVVVAVVALLAVLGPGLTLGVWTWQHRSGVGLAVAATGEPAVPAVGRQMQESAGLRVLTLEAATDGVVAGVLAHDGRQMTEVSRVVEATRLEDPASLEDPATLDVADVAARLASGATTDVSGDLVALGVGAVLVPPGEGTDRMALAGRLDATAGLERVTATASGTIWRVTGVTSAGWARVLDTRPGQDGTLLEVLPADGGGFDLDLAVGTGPRLLVLAERADSGWHAELEGEPLRAVETGWQQAFELPAEGGRLVVEHAPVTRTPWLVLQALVFGVTVLLAVPVRRRRGAR